MRSINDMRNLRVHILALVLTGLAAGPALALSSKAGTSGAQFLKLGAGARAAGMGHAYAAAADDVHAAYYNPGALTRLAKPEVSAAHTQYFQGTKYEYAAWALPFDRKETWSSHALGLSLYSFKVEDIERRTQDTDLAAGLFSAADFAYQVTYSYRKTEHFGLGVSAKVVRETLDTVKQSAFAFDLGAHRRFENGRLPFPVDLAVVARNLGTKLNYAQGSDPLPTALVLGAAVHPTRALTLDLDLIKYRDTNVLIALGAEYEGALYKEIRGALRGGFSTHRSDLDGLSTVTAGGALSLRRTEIGFAWVPFGDLGNTFRYELKVRF